jgi:hypothetical protein
MEGIPVSGIASFFLSRETKLGVGRFMLIILNGYTTWCGLQSLLASSSIDSFLVSREFSTLALAVALSFLLWIVLREVCGVDRQLSVRLIALIVYLLLAVWSISFSYAFWRGILTQTTDAPAIADSAIGLWHSIRLYSTGAGALNFTALEMFALLISFLVQIALLALSILDRDRPQSALQ